VNILIDVVAARTGGGPVRIRELAADFPGRHPEHEFVFVIRRELAPVIREIAPAVRTVIPPAAMDRGPPRALWENAVLPVEVRRRGIQVVFSPFNVVPTVWLRPRPWVAVLVSNLAPYSPELRPLYPGVQGLRLEALRRLTDRSVRSADQVFLLSRQGFSLIPERVLGGKGRLVPMAPPAAPGRRDRASDPPIPSEPFFLMASDLVRYKGVETAVRALSLLPEAARPVLLVCGRLQEPEYVRALRREVAERGLQDRVRLLGPVPHERVMALMTAAVGCVVASRFENQSRVPVEAMAAGAPVLASRITAFEEALGDVALSFGTGRAHELSDLMRRLMEDPGLRDRMRAAGLARVAATPPGSASEAILAAITSA
jgi:glycosyltransferase involved in cell wall biosynthesis